MTDENRQTTLRHRVWLILDPPDGIGRGWAMLVNLGLIVLIVLNVIAVLLESVASLHQQYRAAFNLFEVVSVFVFTVEYLLRIWIAPEAHPQMPQGQARRNWARSPMAIIDLIAILPSYLAMFVPFDLRLLRVLRVLRIFKLTRYSSAMTLLRDVFREEAGSFFAGFFILFILLILVSTGAYLVEHKAQPDAFGSIPHAMWWAMVTLTTVGYGDVTPITPLGRVFGGLVTVLGIGVAALPAGILASGLNDHLHRRRDNLRNQFRRALEDGRIDLHEAAHIEKARKEMGISYEIASGIREEVLQRERDRRDCTCPNCGAQFTRD
ncbi:Ion transport protein [Paracoccus tegillarcae]|uniref:Ion transport protein n=2 Tax=Paracoccus tegillarcae TaxID=1529068 RepID=A0A2K9ELZ0_9RHOB|nr:Ion transport protein [Paracoccus tegillarcae]